MINLTDLIYLKKGFLSDEECQIIIDDFENSPAEAAQERCLMHLQERIFYLHSP